MARRHAEQHEQKRQQQRQQRLPWSSLTHACIAAGVGVREAHIGGGLREGPAAVWTRQFCGYCMPRLSCIQDWLGCTVLCRHCIAHHQAQPARPTSQKNDKRQQQAHLQEEHVCHAAGQARHAGGIVGACQGWLQLTVLHPCLTRHTVRTSSPACQLIQCQGTSIQLNSARSRAQVLSVSSAAFQSSPQPPHLFQAHLLRISRSPPGVG